MGYTRSNVRALVEAVVPRTPELAASHGEAQVPGGADVGLEEYVIESFDSYQEHHLGVLSTVLRRLGIRNYPYALLVAVLLDVVAVELLLRRKNERGVALLSLAGPFARLAPQDRLRAVELLETGALDSLAARFEERLPVLGTVRFLAMGLNAFPLLGYYSEWAGETQRANPAWRQTGYPGPAEGYSEHMGYEVESFDDDWDPDEFDEEDPADRWAPGQFDEWPPDDFAGVGSASDSGARAEDGRSAADSTGESERGDGRAGVGR